MKRSTKWAGVCVGLFSVLGIGFVAGRARAGGIPNVGALTYTGLLHDAKGAPLAGPEYLEIQFWDDPRQTSRKSLLCDTGTPTAIPLVDGRFSITLPDECAEAVADHADIYVDVIVGPSQAEAVSLGVRSKLGAVPYALEAGNAARLDGRPANDYQLRVADSCPDGQTALGINEDGSMNCGALITGWTDYTPKLVTNADGFPAVTSGIDNISGKWRRVGDSIEVMIKSGFNTNAADDSALLWSLPEGVTVASNLATDVGGSSETWNGSTASVCIPSAYLGYPGISLDCHGASSLRRSDVGPRGSGKVAAVGIRYTIPVVGWTLTSP